MPDQPLDLFPEFKPRFFNHPEIRAILARNRIRWNHELARLAPDGLPAAAELFHLCRQINADPRKISRREQLIAAADHFYQGAIDELLEPPESDKADISDEFAPWPEYMSAKDLALRLGLPLDSTRKILERLAKKTDCFIDNESPRRNEPKRLYRVHDVLRLLR